MNIAAYAKSRHATKAFDPGRRIPEEQIEQLRVLLRLSPSSINSQPWHFLIAGSDAGKARIAKAAQGPYAYNEAKIRNASHVVVCCARLSLDDPHLAAVLDQEERDGRIPSPDAKAAIQKTRAFYVGQHRLDRNDERAWLDQQVYIALGGLLLGAASLEIDACPMEGFDPALLDQELGLGERGLTSLVLVALGYSGAGDFNAALPKSRLPVEQVITEL